VHDSWLPVFVQQILNTAKEALGVKNSSQKLMENIQDISERYKTWKKDGTTNNEAATNKEEANTRLGM
jgi:inorganic pyrophosphatase